MDRRARLDPGGDEVRSLDTFDVVYAWGVLHHTGALHSALGAAARLVAPGGLFAFAPSCTMMCGLGAGKSAGTAPLRRRRSGARAHGQLTASRCGSADNAACRRSLLTGPRFTCRSPCCIFATVHNRAALRPDGVFRGTPMSDSGPAPKTDVDPVCGAIEVVFYPSTLKPLKSRPSPRFARDWGGPCH